jgi:hypothetical protein
MEKLKQSALLALSRKEGQGIVEQLKRREFIDQLMLAKDRGENRWDVRNGEIPEAIFSKEMEGGEISVMLVTRMQGISIEQMRSGGPSPEWLRMKARFCFAEDERLRLLVEAHPEKSHFMPVQWTGSQASGYAADMVPCHDVSMIIARCITLHEALQGVLRDARVGDAVHMNEVIEKLGGALKAIGNTNPHKESVSAYMKPLLEKARVRVAAAYELLRTDGNILEALEDVADK